MKTAALLSACLFLTLLVPEPVEAQEPTEAQESPGAQEATAAQKSGAPVPKSMSLIDYVETYVAASDDIAEIRTAIGDRQTELEAAAIRRESALRIEELEVALEANRMSERGVINREIMEAVELFLGYVQAERDYELAEYSLSVAEREYLRMQGRLASGVITERDLLNTLNSKLKAQNTMAGVERALSQSRAKLTRILDLEQDTRFDTDITWSGVDPSTLETDAGLVKENSPDYYLSRNLALLREKAAKAKSDGAIYTREEIETAQEELEDARTQLNNTMWEIEDRITEIRFRTATVNTDKQIQRNNLELRKRELEELVLKLSYGEVYPSDVDAGRRALRDAEHALLQSEADIHTLYLEWVDITGGDCLTALKAILE